MNRGALFIISYIMRPAGQGAGILPANGHITPKKGRVKERRVKEEPKHEWTSLSRILALENSKEGKKGKER